MPSPGNYIFAVQVTRQLCVDILNDFSNRGCRVVLLTGEISNVTTPLNSEIKVIYLNRYVRETMTKRVMSWLVFTLMSFIKIVSHPNNYQLVFISTPPITAFIGLVFRLIRSQKYHLVQWDLYPEALLALRDNPLRNLIIRCWHWCNRFLFKHAESIITLGDSMAQAIKRFDDINTPVHIIHNWADTKIISPIDKNINPFAIEHSQQKKLTVMYSGNMGQTHRIEVLIHAAGALSEYSDINFILAGEGVKKKQLEQMVSAMNLTNVKILPFQDPEVFPYAIAAADISVVTLDQGLDQVSVPSKTYSALAAGCAILAIGGRNSELRSIVEQFRCGCHCEYDNADCISSFIKEMYHNRVLLDDLKLNARRASLNFTPDNAKLYFQYLCTTN